MTDAWTKMPVSKVRPGDRVRTANGNELLVSRVDAAFMGRAEMFALIQDTPDRWFKQPVPSSAEVDVRRD